MERGSDRTKFDRLRALLKRLLHDDSIELEVTFDSTGIVASRDGLRLPLDHYGTGIHQLMILSVAVMAHSKSIVCVEEPEAHLHPRLQREWVRFLMTETDNWYVIATHSNAMLDLAPDVEVLRLSRTNGKTTAAAASSRLEALALLADLGVRASDLLQANCVVWVEGPSDRTYLRRWLELIAPEYREGTHYAMMFYGGRLLSHLELVGDADTEADFIDLLRLNQHTCVVVDSDRGTADEELNATKTRIKQECDSCGAAFLATPGREIENLIPADVIVRAYEAIAGIRAPVALGPFDRLQTQLETAFTTQWESKWTYEKNNEPPPFFVPPSMRAPS